MRSLERTTQEKALVMARYERRTVRNTAVHTDDERRRLSDNRGNEFRPVSFLLGVLFIAAIIAVVYFSGGLNDATTLQAIDQGAGS